MLKAVPTITADWMIGLSVLHMLVCILAVRARRHAKLQTAVEEALLTIICAVNDKKDHIPPVVSPHLITFPFDITVTG